MSDILHTSVFRRRSHSFRQCFLSVSTRIQVSGVSWYTGVWACGCLFIRVSGYTGVWVDGCVDIRVFGIGVYHVVMATANNHWNSCI